MKYSHFHSGSSSQSSANQHLVFQRLLLLHKSGNTQVDCPFLFLSYKYHDLLLFFVIYPSESKSPHCHSALLPIIVIVFTLPPTVKCSHQVSIVLESIVAIVTKEPSSEAAFPIVVLQRTDTTEIFKGANFSSIIIPGILEQSWVAGSQV